MTALQELELYLKNLERRVRYLLASRGAAALCGCGLLLTVAFTWFANEHKFAAGIVLPLRILLFAALAATLVSLLAIPLLRTNRKRVSQLAESRIPELKERLLTFTERRDSNNPFHELVAEDTLRVAREHAATPLVSRAAVYGSAVAASATLGVLCWLIVAGPGYWGYGASLLWTGTPRAGTQPLYEIHVQPGNATIRRKADQVISAELVGFSTSNVVLHAKYQGGLKWETIPMQAEPAASGYQFLFAGLSDSLDYYVQAGDARSKQFTVRVKDLPQVQRLRVHVHYPAGLGLKDAVDDPGGDIRAVSGSEANVSVLTDKRLDHGALVFDDGTQIALAPGDAGWAKATLSIRKDGTYHVAALDDGHAVRITDDYFIEAKKDEAPSVRILHPGHDPRVSPIEEMPVAVEAADDFGVRSLELHYSVNGGPEQTRALTKSSAKEARGETTLSLEDFKLAPGDLVSLYATAQDGTHTSRSDMVFAQAEPFDFKFRQSQQAGGGGGGGAGDQGNDISERQKEIIAATWNQLRSTGNSAAAASIGQNARFLSGVEQKLSDQANALSKRMGNRELTAANPQFEEFSKSMLEASNDMSKASGQLQPGQWNQALPSEQQALKALLHAESIFRDIQVSFGKGGGGGGGNGQERELARLLDLELDRSKNQYETAQQQSEPAQAQQQKQLDDALEKLKALAQRQQELAEQPKSQAQEFQQRWEQEQLRREAEQLRQQVEQLSRNSQSQQQGSQSQSGGEQAQQQGSPSSSVGKTSKGGAQSQRGNGGTRDQRSNGSSAMQDAMNSLEQAEQQMRQAASQHDSQARQRAAEQLAHAQNLLQNSLRQQAGNELSQLTQTARELADKQKSLGNRVKNLYGVKGEQEQRGGESAEDAGQMPEMRGPGYAGGYRRNFYAYPRRPASGEEKTLAAESERLSEQARKLQEQMQQQARRLGGEQPEATRKLRQALSDAEQQELAERMKKNAEWLRDGYGSQTWPLEESITRGAEQLAGQLAEAERALGENAKNGKGGSGMGEDDKLAQAVAQVRALREQLQSQSGSQQSGSDQNGSQQGDLQQGGQNGSARDGRLQRGMPSGQLAGSKPQMGGGSDQPDPVQQLNGLRSQLGRNDRQLNGYFNDAIGALRHGPGKSGLLDARLQQDAITNLGRLELELERRMRQQNAGPRTMAPETAPESYREAVANYFRTLSQ